MGFIIKYCHKKQLYVIFSLFFKYEVMPSLVGGEKWRQHPHYFVCFKHLIPLASTPKSAIIVTRYATSDGNSHERP